MDGSLTLPEDNFWCFWEKKYPYQLARIPDFPPVLFYKGSYEISAIPSEKLVAVVGTRKIIEDYRELTAELANFLAANGYTVVSGLAMGVDAVALQTSAEKCPSVAVIPGGVAEAVPKTNTYLYRRILDGGGLVLSEDNSKEVSKYNFPRRNRIIAGLCRATIVVQAPVKSGSMITAKQAFSYGREIFTFPGSIYDVRLAGNNYLLKTNMAQAITEPDDLKYFFPELIYQPFNAPKESRVVGSLEKEERQVYELLLTEPLELEQLCAKIDKTVGDVLSLLGLLEVKKLIKLDISTGSYRVKK